MKVRSSVKPICEKCKIIRRKGKVMVIWFPTMAFVAIGFQHSVANAFAIPAAIFEGGATWMEFIRNFSLVYAGNIIGGVIFVAGFYFLGYKRQMNELNK